MLFFSSDERIRWTAINTNRCLKQHPSKPKFSWNVDFVKETQAAASVSKLTYALQRFQPFSKRRISRSDNGLSHTSRITTKNSKDSPKIYNFFPSKRYARLDYQHTDVVRPYD